MTDNEKIAYLKNAYKDNEDILKLIEQTEKDDTKKGNWMEDLEMALSVMCGLSQEEIDIMNS